MLFPHCAAIYKPTPPENPLVEETVKRIIADIQEQQERVFSFYTNSKISAKNWYGESEANILIVGKRSPLKIKIEITHTWGAPILYILIDQMRLEVLSFADKKLYLGNFTPESLSKFFPGFIEPDLIWAVLRGFPNLQRFHRIKSRRANQITLFNEIDKEVQIIDIYADSLLPKLVTFPEKHLEMAFSGFREKGGIIFAEKVKVDHRKDKKGITLKNSDMIFNKTIPEAVFIQKKPPSFETIYLRD